MKNLPKYKIAYDNGVVQDKYLLTHQDFSMLRQYEQVKYNYEALSKKEKEKLGDAAYKEAIEKIREYPEIYFVESSPLHDAMSTGRLKTDYTNMGVKFEKIVTN